MRRTTAGAGRWRLALGVGLTVVVAGLSVAGRAQPGGARLMALEGEGKVESVTQEGVAALIGGNLFLIGLAPDAAVAVRGPASRDCLVANTPVGFSVELDDKGKPAGAVGRISLHAAGQPGIHADNEQPGKKPVRKRMAGTYQVVGTVRGVTPDGEFTIVAGTDRLMITLAEDAIIEVDSPNLTLAQKGDALTVSGSYAQPTDIQPGQPLPPLAAQARQLTITMAKPFEPKGKKRPLKPQARKTPAAAEKAPDAGEKAPDAGEKAAAAGE